MLFILQSLSLMFPCAWWFDYLFSGTNVFFYHFKELIILINLISQYFLFRELKRKHIALANGKTKIIIQEYLCGFEGKQLKKHFVAEYAVQYYYKLGIWKSKALRTHGKTSNHIKILKLINVSPLFQNCLKHQYPIMFSIKKHLQFYLIK